VITSGVDEWDSPAHVWPSDHNYRPARCPRGHNLAIGGRTGGYDHGHRAKTLLCDVCRGDDQNPGVGEWALIDPADQVNPDAARRAGTELVAHPPPVRAGVGRIEVHHDGHIVGDVDLMLCGVDERGVIEHIRVETRRLGYGRLLVAAARARGYGYTWSTTTIDRTFEARAFWSRVGWPGVGEPFYCSHMLQAAELTP
jgi:hypothetical protein